MAQMLTCLDDLSSLTAKPSADKEERLEGGDEQEVARLMEGKHVVVIGERWGCWPIFHIIFQPPHPIVWSHPQARPTAPTR